jgi:hypothetical protein
MKKKLSQSKGAIYQRELYRRKKSEKLNGGNLANGELKLKVAVDRLCESAWMKVNCPHIVHIPTEDFQQLLDAVANE